MVSKRLETAKLLSSTAVRPTSTLNIRRIGSGRCISGTTLDNWPGREASLVGKSDTHHPHTTMLPSASRFSDLTKAFIMDAKESSYAS